MLVFTWAILLVQEARYKTLAQPAAVAAGA
jgi:hypothetical protein